jgi:hypothetical protein
VNPDSEIECTLEVPSVANSPAVVTVKNFNRVLQGDRMELHLPNIKNPECQASVTVDLPCPTSSHLTIKIIVVQGRKYKSFDISIALIPCTRTMQAMQT